MKLLGCFKIVPDLEMLSDEDFVADARHYVDTSFVKTAWNCFDESALEMMLKLSDYSESFLVMYELSALTIGKELCDSYLRVLYALGFKQAARIDCNENLAYRPELIAAGIASYVQNKGGQSVVVMGRQTADGDNSKTPLLTAELLGWPCITQVVKFAPVDEEHLCIESMTEDGLLKQVIKIPCVISVGDAPNSYLRVPTLKDRMKLGKQEIAHYSFSDLGIDANAEGYIADLEPISVLPINNDRQTIRITEKSPAKAAEVVYNSYLKGRLEEL